MEEARTDEARTDEARTDEARTDEARMDEARLDEARLDEARLEAYCAGKPGAWPDNPWSEDHPVFKVGPSGAGKIFAFLGADTVGVKSGTSREVADEWLHRYPADAAVMAYIGRSGWNTLALQGGIPDEELLEAVDESYRMVVEKLPKRQRPEGWEG